MSAQPPASRRVWALQTAALLLVIWLALDGFDNVVVGLGFASLGAAIGTWLVPGEPYPWRPLRLAAFFAYFVRESLRGGIDVAWRALHPAMPIAPVVVEFRTALAPGLPQAVMLGVISLLPGTLSVLLGEDGRMRVHVLTTKAAEGLAELDRRVGLLFSLDRERSGR